MAGGMRPLPDYDPETDPELGDALQRFYAANPADVAGVTVRRSPPAAGGAPPPMTAPAAALQSMADGAGPAAPPEEPSLLDRAARWGAETFTAPGLLQAWRDEPRTERTPLQSLSDKVEDVRNPLPDASMPTLAPAPPAQVPRGLEPPSVRVGKAAHVDVPNTAVAQSMDRGPLPADHPAVVKGLESARSNVKAAPDAAGSDLDAALRQSADRRLVAGMTRAGGAMVGRGQGAGYDRLDEEADRPLQELQLRRADAEQGKARALAAQETDPNSPQSQQVRAMLTRMAPELGKDPAFAGLTAARAKEVFPWAKELFEASSKRELEGMKIKGEIDKVKAKHAGGGGAAGLSKEAAKELAVLQRSWDPSGPRSGERGKNQARVNAAGRIEALASGPGGQVADLNPQQMTELARQLDTLLSNGGQATEGVTKALSAHTATGRVADLLQWWTSAPHGAGQQEFTKQMLETARREKSVAGKQLRDSYVATLPTVPILLKERPDVIQNMLRGQGVDPSTIDMGTGLARDTGQPVDVDGAPRKQYSPSRNQTRLIYPDGRVEVHDGRL